MNRRRSALRPRFFGVPLVVGCTAMLTGVLGCNSTATIDLFPLSGSEGEVVTSVPMGGGGTGGSAAAGGAEPLVARDAGASGAVVGSASVDASAVGGSSSEPDAEPEPVPNTDAGVSPTPTASSVPSDEPSTAEPPNPYPDPIHRYRFGGFGVVAVDDIGEAHGDIIGGAQLDGSGTLTLDGNDDYVDLPNGIVSSLSDASFAAWFIWRGNNCWHRIFSFGNTVQGEGEVGERLTELFVTPLNCEPVGLTSMIQLGNADGLTAQTALVTDAALQPDILQHVVLVIDEALAEMRLYLNGVEVGVQTNTLPLSSIVDENNWLGRSQWVQDFNLPGAYHEFQIYDVALTPDDVAALYAAPPD